MTDTQLRQIGDRRGGGVKVKSGVELDAICGSRFNRHGIVLVGALSWSAVRMNWERTYGKGRAASPPVARSFPCCCGAQSACLFANESRAPTWLIPSLLSGQANRIRS